jgi:hypothetical protein
MVVQSQPGQKISYAGGVSKRIVVQAGPGKKQDTLPEK